MLGEKLERKDGLLGVNQQFRQPSPRLHERSLAPEAEAELTFMLGFRRARNSRDADSVSRTVERGATKTTSFKTIGTGARSSSGCGFSMTMSVGATRRRMGGWRSRIPSRTGCTRFKPATGKQSGSSGNAISTAWWAWPG